MKVRDYGVSVVISSPADGGWTLDPEETTRLRARPTDQAGSQEHGDA